MEPQEGSVNMYILPNHILVTIIFEKEQTCIQLLVSNSSFNPLGANVFDLKTQNAFFAKQCNFFFFIIYQGLVCNEFYRITSRHLMSMLWCNKVLKAMVIASPLGDSSLFTHMLVHGTDDI